MDTGGRPGRAVPARRRPIGSLHVVDEDGNRSTTPPGATHADDARREERLALDEIEAALGDVAATLARMG